MAETDLFSASIMDASPAASFKVVVNDEEQFSIWPVSRPNPPGWRDEGCVGPQDHCLDHIEHVWTDMTPGSLRGVSHPGAAPSAPDVAPRRQEPSVPSGASGDAGVCRIGSNPKAAMRLYCFPHAGGAAHAFEEWQKELPTSIEVAAIELRGRGRRFDERLVLDFDRHVDEAAQSIGEHSDMPAAYFGHSMGAVLAFEVIRRLRAAGKPRPLGLFVSAHRAPQLPDRTPTLHMLEDAALLERLRDWSGTSDAILKNPALSSIFLPILRADLTAASRYRYESGPPLDCPIVAYAGTQDSEASIDEVRAWRTQTSADFSLHVYSGGHFFIQEPRSGFMAEFVHALRGMSAALLMKNFTTSETAVGMS
jgi:medium-chain acyl-[acyl-carrier-protein] hydrolase